MRSQTAFLFILAVFLSFVCSGCGKETPPLSQQKLLEASTEASLRQIYDDLQKNPKKAEYYYCDTILLLDGEILAITDDTVFLQEGQLHVLCSLPAQSLRTLAIGQTISVVGQTAPRFLAVKKNPPYARYCLRMRTAYLVDRANGRTEYPNVSISPAPSGQIDAEEASSLFLDFS